MAPRKIGNGGMATDAMDVKGEVVAASRISVKVKDHSGAIKEIVVKIANGESITYVVENPGPSSPPPEPKRMPVCRGKKCGREFRSDDEFYCAHCGLHRQEFSDRIFECRDKMCTKCGEKRGRVRQEFARFVEKVLKDHAGDLPAGEFTLEEDHVKQKVRTIIKGNYDNFKQEMERVGMHLIDQEAIFDYVRSRQKHLRKKAKKGAAPGGNIVQQEVNAEPQKVKAKPQEVKQTKRRKTQEVNKGPQEVDEEPQEVNAEPQKVKEKPQKVKAEPLKVDAELQEVKAEPREVKQTKRRKTKWTRVALV